MDNQVRIPESEEPVGGEGDYLGHWPYRTVESVQDIQALSMWLLELGGLYEQQPLGIAVRPDELAFATRDQGWLIKAPSEMLGSMLVSCLLPSSSSPMLITRDIPTTVNTLFEAWLPEEAEQSRDEFITHLMHDMSALSYVIGRPISNSLPTLQDALDAATVGQMMAIDSPRFYQQVSLPVKKEKARGTDWNPENLNRWTLTYDYLLFRVLTHYTRDPTLVKWWEDGANPLKEFGSLLELTSQEAAAFLLWMSCGEDDSLLAARYPSWFTHMPDSPQLVKASRVDKRIPTLRLGLLQLTEGFLSGLRSKTLYGRLSPWGLKPSELLHFMILGSVNDILDVALASFLRTESHYQYLVPEASSGYSPWLRAQFVGYTEQDSLEWQQELEQLGALSNPLHSVNLDPKVSVE